MREQEGLHEKLVSIVDAKDCFLFRLSKCSLTDQELFKCAFDANLNINIFEDRKAFSQYFYFSLYLCAC